MDGDEIKVVIEELQRDVEAGPEGAHRESVRRLLNLIERVVAENARLRAENDLLRKQRKRRTRFTTTSGNSSGRGWRPRRTNLSTTRRRRIRGKIVVRGVGPFLTAVEFLAAADPRAGSDGNPTERLAFERIHRNGGAIAFGRTPSGPELTDVTSPSGVAAQALIPVQDAAPEGTATGCRLSGTQRR